MKRKALAQLRSGESLTGKNGAFAPLLKEFTEAALFVSLGNKRNGKGRKTLKTMDREICIDTPQDRLSSFSPEMGL